MADQLAAQRDQAEAGGGGQPVDAPPRRRPAAEAAAAGPERQPRGGRCAPPRRRRSLRPPAAATYAPVTGRRPARLVTYPTLASVPRGGHADGGRAAAVAGGRAATCVATGLATRPGPSAPAPIQLRRDRLPGPGELQLHPACRGPSVQAAAGHAASQTGGADPGPATPSSRPWPRPSPPSVTVSASRRDPPLPPSATLNLRRFALAHKGVPVTVTGHGEAVLPGADSQSRALDLALRRAQAIAASLGDVGRRPGRQPAPPCAEPRAGRHRSAFRSTTRVSHQGKSMSASRVPPHPPPAALRVRLRQRRQGAGAGGG